MNAFGLGILDAFEKEAGLVEKIALKASTVASAASKRGVTPEFMKDLAQSRAPYYSYGKGETLKDLIHNARYGKSGEAYATAMHDPDQAKNYLKSYLANKKHLVTR